MAVYKRILLKLSGEALAGKQGYGIETDAITTVCRQIKEVHDLGVQIAVVVGGGNIFRGLSASAEDIDRTTADHMGMLATIINGLAIQDAFEKTGVDTRHLSSIPIQQAVEQFNLRKAIRYLEERSIVIFSGGTGNPYFSTDTAAALRAAQIDADIILKGTKVDGVFEGDPVKDPSVKKYDSITFSEVLRRGLRVMDATAFAMCRDNSIPIIVFNFTREGTLLRVINGEPIGTIVKEDVNG